MKSRRKKPKIAPGDMPLGITALQLAATVTATGVSAAVAEQFAREWSARFAYRTLDEPDQMKLQREMLAWIQANTPKA